MNSFGVFLSHRIRKWNKNLDILEKRKNLTILNTFHGLYVFVIPSNLQYPMLHISTT